MHRLMMVVPAVWLAGCAIDADDDDVLVHVGDDEVADPGEVDPGPDSPGAIAYWSSQPMGFARVSSFGAILTQFDSVATPADAGVTVTHASPGVYTVSFANLGSPVPWPWTGPGAGGHVQITSEDQGASRCRISTWGGSPHMSIGVRCNLPSGAAADSGFAVLTYRRNHPAPSTSYAYAAYSWVQADGTVDPVYDFNATGTHNTVSHPSTGRYVITTPGMNDVNNGLLVTAYGGADPGSTCSINNWSGGSAIVSCYAPSGALVNSAFTFSRTAYGPSLYQQGAHAWFNGTSLDPTYARVVQRSCGSASVAAWPGALVTIDVNGELASWDSTPFLRASFVSGYNYDGDPAGYCKIENFSVWGTVPATTARTQVRCYRTDGSVFANPKMTFVHLGSDGWGPC